MTATTDLQKGLNEVVMNKVHRMIDGKAAGVKATMERLINEGKIAQDYIAPIGVNLKAKSHTPVITFSGGQPTDGFTEVEEISSQPLTMNMPDGVQGGATLWKLTQAITAHARELTPERSRELHELSGQLMNRVKLNK